MEPKFAYTPWEVTEEGFDPKTLRENESVFALANGANMESSWYYNDWMNEEHKNMAICSCNDGLRPVIIKVERIEETAGAE